MLGFKRVTIAQHERGLVFRNRNFKTILEPGVYRIFNPLKRVEVQIYDLTVTEFEHPRVDFLVKEARATIEKYFTLVELSDREVGVVYKNGRVAGLVAPGKRQLYWRGPVDVRVDKFDFCKEFELPKELAKVLVRAKQPLAAQVADAVAAVEVADTSVGLLIAAGSRPAPHPPSRQNDRGVMVSFARSGIAARWDPYASKGARGGCGAKSAGHGVGPRRSRPSSPGVVGRIHVFDVERSDRGHLRDVFARLRPVEVRLPAWEHHHGPGCVCR